MFPPVTTLSAHPDSEAPYCSHDIMRPPITNPVLTSGMRFNCNGLDYAIFHIDYYSRVLLGLALGKAFPVILYRTVNAVVDIMAFLCKHYSSEVYSVLRSKKEKAKTDKV